MAFEARVLLERLSEAEGFGTADLAGSSIWPLQRAFRLFASGPIHPAPLAENDGDLLLGEYGVAYGGRRERDRFEVSLTRQLIFDTATEEHGQMMRVGCSVFYELTEGLKQAGDFELWGVASDSFFADLREALRAFEDLPPIEAVFSQTST